MRRWMIVAALLLCLPMVGEGQSIAYHPSYVGGTVAADVAAPLNIPTATTSLEALRTWTIPANTFPSTTKAGFSTTCITRGLNNANNKNARLYFGGIAGTQILAEANSTANQLFIQTADCVFDSATTFACFIRRCIGASCANTTNPYTFDPTVALQVTCAGYTSPAGDVYLTAHLNYWLMK